MGTNNCQIDIFYGYRPQNISLLGIVMKSTFRKIFSAENLYALLVCLIVIAIIILTADQAPQWIYQGF